MSDPDPWRRLRDAPAPSRRWRGTWRPTREPPAAQGDPERHGLPAVEPPGPSGEGVDDPAVEPPRLARPHALVMAAVGALAVLGTGVLLWTTQPRAESVPTAEATATPSDPVVDPSDPVTGATEPAAPGTDPAMGDPSAGSAPPPPVDVVVHVAGRVHRPGVVVLPVGSRVVDAVEAAGGALADTSLESVNLARLLTDGEQVRVGLPPDPAVEGAASTPPGTAPVDINSADVDDLDALPGIGPVLARRIVDWRVQNGPFTQVEQLMEVAGIGPSVLDDLAGKVRV